MTDSIDDKLAAVFKSWYDGSLLEPKMLKIYQTIIDDGMQDGLGSDVSNACNALIDSGACTPRKPRPIPGVRREHGI